MGKEKLRGSKQERINHAFIRQQQNIANIRQEYNIPEDAKFCGYIVYFPDNDEFLAALKVTSSYTEWKFARAPNFAHFF